MSKQEKMLVKLIAIINNSKTSGQFRRKIERLSPEEVLMMEAIFDFINEDKKDNKKSPYQG